MAKIKVLFDLKKEYYFNSLYPLYREMVKDDRYEIYFRIGKDHKRFLWIFLINEKNRIAEWMKKEGYRLTDETAGFDLVVCGDALKDPEKYGDCLRVHLDHGGKKCPLDHHNCMKNIKPEFVRKLIGDFYNV